MRRRQKVAADHTYNRFRNKVQPAILSKLREFHVLGYDTVTADSLWDFLINSKWKNQSENIRLYEIVSDILAVKIGEYMTYTTVESFKASEAGPFSISEEERKALFGED